MPDNSFAKSKFLWCKSVWRSPHLSPGAVRTGLEIANHVNVKSGCAWPSEQRLAQLLGCSRKTVQRAVSELVAARLIYRKKQRGRSNQYRLRFEAVEREVAGDKTHSVDKTACSTGQNCLLGTDEDVPQNQRTNNTRNQQGLDNKEKSPFRTKSPTHITHSHVRPTSLLRSPERTRYEAIVVRALGPEGAAIAAALPEAVLDHLMQLARNIALTHRDVDEAKKYARQTPLE
jgi:DNA-binding transcriptional MocR family regulator